LSKLNCGQGQVVSLFLYWTRPRPLQRLDERPRGRDHDGCRRTRFDLQLESWNAARAPTAVETIVGAEAPLLVGDGYLSLRAGPLVSTPKGGREACNATPMSSVGLRGQYRAHSESGGEQVSRYESIVGWARKIGVGGGALALPTVVHGLVLFGGVGERV
jgi:hypothetical protein